MKQLLEKLKSLLVGVKAEYLHEKSKLSLDIFNKALEELRQINSQASAHKLQHSKIIEESRKEIESVESLISKNSKVIEKIEEIIN